MCPLLDPFSPPSCLLAPNRTKQGLNRDSARYFAFLGLPGGNCRARGQVLLYNNFPFSSSLGWVTPRRHMRFPANDRGRIFHLESTALGSIPLGFGSGLLSGRIFEQALGWAEGPGSGLHLAQFLGREQRARPLGRDLPHPPQAAVLAPVSVHSTICSRALAHPKADLFGWRLWPPDDEPVHACRPKRSHPEKGPDHKDAHLHRPGAIEHISRHDGAPCSVKG